MEQSDTYTERLLTLPSGQLHVEITGSGSPLILMHGWGCSHSTVRSIAQIASQTHQVWNVDFPGFGDSPEPLTIWGIEEYTRQIEELIQANNLKNPVLVGHSFGGRVGILLASRNRNVEKLVLVDSAGIKPRRSLRYYCKVYSFKTLKALWNTILGPKRAQEHIERLRAKAGSSDYAGASPRMRQILSRVVNEDLTDRLQDINCPTLLIWGSDDKATPLRDAQLMERLIPDAGLVTFEGCGHYSFLDARSQFRAVLSSFLTTKEK